jgi:integrase
VAALTKEHLIAVISSLGSAPKDVRDRALLLMGFAGAFRRSELIAVDCKSIERRGAGIVISVRKSKTDQDRRGREVAIPYAQGAVCPIQALDAWLDLANIADGPVFRPVTKHGDVLPRSLAIPAIRSGLALSPVRPWLTFRSGRSKLRPVTPQTRHSADTFAAASCSPVTQ